MVTVGTAVASRPPYRSRRALLTHRAPPSGQTSCAERFSVARRPTRSHYPDRRGISAQCPNRGRLTAVPLGEALPSTTSAGSCLPLFGRFAGTMASSDFSSTYMLGVRLVAFPSRPGTRVRAWMRPPRFRAKNFSTCTRSPTARGSSHASQYVMGRCCLLFNGTRSAPRNWTRFAARYLARGLPCERFTSALAGRRASLGVGAVG